jgi:hypothetical protein
VKGRLGKKTDAVAFLPKEFLQLANMMSLVSNRYDLRLKKAQFIKRFANNVGTVFKK